MDMPPRPSQGSQSWLAGADNSLDNYFKGAGALVPPSSTSKRATGSRNAGSSTNGKASLGAGSKRKRDPSSKHRPLKEVDGPIAKRAKLVREGHGDARHSPPPKSRAKAKAKGKARQALGDLTSALQNSPHRRRVSTSISAKDKSKTVIQLDDEDGSSSELEYSTANASKRLPALTFGKTPANGLNAHLLTPPSSSMIPRHRLVTDEHSSSPTFHLTSPNQKQPQQSNNAEKLAAQTPFAFVGAPSKRGYPTPMSIAVPRLHFTRPSNAEDDNPTPSLPAPNLTLDFESDSPLTSLSSSSPAKSTKSNYDEAAEDHDVRETKTNDVPRVNTIAITPRKDKGKSRSYMYEVIPSSQTQYIHYSPTKKKTRKESSEDQDRYVNPVWTRKNKALDLMVIPCSQSQSQASSSSFEVLLPQRDASQNNTGASGIGISVSVSPSRRQRQRSVLNLVVPTSQEDEIEISLTDETGALPRFSQPVREYSSMVGKNAEADEKRLDVGTKSQKQKRVEEKSQANNESNQLGQKATAFSTTATTTEPDPPSQLTQMRFINTILDDLDRLAEETRLNTTTASQVLARPCSRIPNPASSSSLLSGSNSSRGRRQNLFMQSSVTEPDSSQWGEDPFSLTNEAYARHLGLRVSRPSTNTTTTSRRHREWENAESLPTCTQSSATQPDSDEEDPFPTLPPPPAPPSTAETCGRIGVGASQTQSETETETENEDEDGENEDEDEAMSMPNITSPDDTFDFRLLSPREVRRVVEGGMRSRRRDRNSFVLHSSGRGGQEQGEDEDEDEGEEMPNTVREFLRMLDTQNQSLDWSQNQAQD